MAQSKLVTISRTQGGNYRKVKGGKAEVGTKGEHVVQHYPVENFLVDLPKVLTNLHDNPREVLLTWPSKIPHNKVVPNRQKALLGTDYSYSTIGIIDIDEINGKPIESDGRPLEEQINSVLEQHLPYEVFMASRIVKMSSSWYTENKIKFHVYFKLAEPVTHSSWAEFCQINIPIADKSLISNSAQIAFSARPKGVNTEIKLFSFEGDALFVDKQVYKSPHKIKRNTVSDVSHGIALKTGDITKRSLATNLDMSSDSHIKSFTSYREIIASGYDPSTLKGMAEQLEARGGKAAERIVTQSDAALKHIVARCTDPFFDTQEVVLANDEYIDLTDLVENEDSKTINLIKGTTGIGKTQAMTSFCKGKSSVIVGQTRLLVRQNSDDFNAFPVDQDVSYGTDLSVHNSISTTIHSIYKLADAVYSNPYDVLFIDEASQTLKAWLSLGEDEKVKTLEVMESLFAKSRYVVLADADLTETAIQGYEKLLGIEFKCHSKNVSKKDFESRAVYIYETKGEVLSALQKSLDDGNKCLAVVDNKEYLHENAEKKIKVPNAYFFSKETENEESHIKFREDPRGFASTASLLFCSPLLKSGVSFVGLFDEVFTIIDGDSFTSRDIIQMLSRERKWKKVHIYTNTKKIALTKPVEQATKFDETLVMVNEDIRQQLFIRPFDTAYRLDKRGANVTFVPCSHETLIGGNIATQEYKADGSDGRAAYEKYVFKLTQASKLLSTKNIIEKHERIKKISGFEVAIKCPLDFYDWVQNNQVLKNEMGTQFAKFSKSLRSMGIHDDNFFNLAKFTNKTRPKQPSKLKDALDGFYLSFERYESALKRFNTHNRLMAAIDSKHEKICVEEDILDLYESLEEVIDI